MPEDARQPRGPVPRRRQPGWLLLGVLLAAAMAVAGCGRTTTTPPGGATGDGVFSPDPARDGIWRIGLVTDQGGLNDRSFNALANVGLERARDELGVEVAVLESRSAANYEVNLTNFARAGFDLVIGVGFLMADPVRDTAIQFPGTRFAIIDFSYGPEHLPNVRGILFREQEAGYLAGYLAGLASRDAALDGMDGSRVLSSIGGQSIPPVNRYIAGYQAAIREVCADCRLLNAYSQDFIQPDKCKEQALSHIGQGAEVVFQVAGGCGLGALNAAEERGVWGIGVDADQSYLGDHILTSAMKNVDVGVFTTIQDVIEGRFQGSGDTVYGLAQDGVGLGPIAEPARRFEADVERMRERIISGEVEVPADIE